MTRRTPTKTASTKKPPTKKSEPRKPAGRQTPRTASPPRRSWVMPVTVGVTLAAVLAGTVWLASAFDDGPRRPCRRR